MNPRVAILGAVLVIGSVGGTFAFTEMRSDGETNQAVAPAATLDPNRCDVACQAERDGQQQAYDQGYQQAQADACPTPLPGHFFAIGSKEWRDYQACLSGN